MAMSDPFNLRRFLDAQASVYANAVRELGAGQKRSHWMWFIFPQISGLGFSPTSVFYAIGSLDEARAYLNHPTLGPRLSECVELTLHVEGKTVAQIFGAVDAQKFRSSLTLFSRARPDISVFAEALAKYFGGEPDAATLERL
jgi:uncharacterized protein (DUF1810 family)